MKVINKVGIFKLPLPNECVCNIMDYAFSRTHDLLKQKKIKINKIIKNGYSRTKECKHFYQIWNDPEHDSFWMHSYLDGKRIVLQNENCVRCGNYREAQEAHIVC